MKYKQYFTERKKINFYRQNQNFTEHLYFSKGIETKTELLEFIRGLTDRLEQIKDFFK